MWNQRKRALAQTQHITFVACCVESFKNLSHFYRERIAVSRCFSLKEKFVTASCIIIHSGGKSQRAGAVGVYQ
jgi:hypothetical protein